MGRDNLLGAAFEAPRIPDPVDADRFRRLLAFCTYRQVVFACAPAGYGKTTLLRSLAADVRSGVDVVVWCRPEGGLREPGVLIPALAQRLGYEATGCTDPASVLREAIVGATRERSLLLVLDDAHEFGPDPQLWAAMERVLQALPAGFRLAIGSRREVPLRLGRLRANGLLADVDASSLRLTEAEVRGLLRAELGSEPPDSLARDVWQRTAGWPACARLVASLARRRGADGLAAMFSAGSILPDHVYAFFAEELLATLPNAALQSIKALSVLPAFDRATAAALCRDGDVDVSVAWARRLGAVDAAVETPESYCFHPLFREFLLQQLRSDGPGVLEEVCGRAATILEGAGHLEDAIDQQLMAGDLESAADLIEEVALTALQTGMYTRMEGWMDALPAALLVRRPALLRREADLDEIRGRLPKAAEKFGAAARLFAVDGDEERAADCLLCSAFCSLETGDLTGARGAAAECASLSCASEASIKWRLLSLEGILAAQSVDVPLAERLLRESAECAAVAGPAAAVTATARRGMLHALVTGHQGRALEWYEAAGRHVAGQTDVERSLYVLANKAAVLAGAGQHRHAKECLAEGLRLALVRGVMIYDSYLRSSLALVDAGQGDLAGACRGYGEALARCEQQGAMADCAWGLAELSQVLRARGAGVRALDLSRRAIETSQHAENAYTWYPAQVEHLACQVSRRPTVDLAADLASLAAECGERRLLGNQARSLYHQGRCLVLLGDEEAAGRQLAAALALAQDLSHFHYFIVEAHGDPSTLLFALDVGAEPEVAKHILDRAEKSVRKTLLEWLDGRAGNGAVARALRLVQTRLVIDPRVIAAAAKHIGRDYGDGPFALAPGPAAMRIRTFGTFSVEIDGRLMEKGDWVKARARELLRMLVTQAGHSLPRDKILARFWPDTSTQTALNSCNVLVNNLRRSLEPDAEPRSVSRFIVWDEGVYSLLPGSTWVDSAAYDAAVSEGESALRRGNTQVARERLAQADALYAGDYMADDLYGDTFFSARERYRQGHLKVLERLIELDSRDAGKAYVAHHLRRLTELDPYDEDAWARLIRCHVGSGDRKGARDAYRQCVRVLGEGDDQGLPPQILQLKKQFANPKSPSRARAQAGRSGR